MLTSNRGQPLLLYSLGFSMLTGLIASLFFTFLMSFLMFKPVVFYVRFLISEEIPRIKINITVPPVSQVAIQQLKEKSISMINERMKHSFKLVFLSWIIVFLNWSMPEIARGVPDLFSHENILLIYTVTHFTGQFLPLVPVFLMFVAGFIHGSKAIFLKNFDNSSQEQDLQIISLIDRLPEDQKDLKYSVEYYLDAVSQQGRSLTFAEAECIIEKLKTRTVDASVNKGAGTGTFSA